jgi:hypothetical protein
MKSRDILCFKMAHFLVYILLTTRFKPFFNEAIDNILQKAERIYRFAQHPTVIYKLTW